jgi:hypothetical protein
MSRKEVTKAFRNVVFRRPSIHDSDHHAVVATIFRGRKGRFKKYWWNCQRFPLQLAPLGEQDRVTHLFGRLKEECKEAVPTKRPWNDWISAETWRLIAHRAMLRRTGRLCQTRGINYTVKLEPHRCRACGWQCPGGLPPPQRVVSGSHRDAVQTMLPHDGASDFGVG